MLLAALLLQAAGPQSAVDAERAFASAAQARGQWTAFRDYAAPNAAMYVPQRVHAQEWLRDRKDPPRSVEWWPTASYVSCDGKLAVNTGGAKWPDGSSGYFTTLWMRQPDGSWKWALDYGAPLEVPRPPVGQPAIRKAECAKLPRRFPRMASPDGKPDASAFDLDDTLTVMPMQLPDGSRRFQVFLWNGTDHVPVIDDVIAAASK